jgi:predicted dienelactone hydrolase
MSHRAPGARPLRSRVLLLLAAGAWLAGCGAAPELPPAAPLRAGNEQLAQIPGLAAGPYPVQTHGPAGITVADRSLRVRAVAPEGDGPFPLVVFSHGFAADIDAYDAVLAHWASHGYLSLAVYHLDGGGTARAIFNSLRKGNLGLIAARVDDLHAVLDAGAALDALAPGLSSRIDYGRIAAAGHSFGAFSAQQLGGAVAIDPDSGERVAGADPRIRAVVAISPPGEMFGVINDRSWTTMAVPMLATTGTWDVDGRFVTEWRQHALSFDTAPAGRNWLLVVEGADHYLGNLICRPKRKVAPQHDALRMVNATTLGFLDAWLRDAAPAQHLLTERPLSTLTGGFATLEYR